MATASCPLSGCGYEGEPSSVEAHVSASTDETHKGKVGRDLRTEIEDGVSEADEERADAPVLEDGFQVAEEDVEEPTEEGAEEDVEAVETSDEDEPDDEGGDDLPSAEAAAGAAAVGGGSMLATSDLDVSGTTVAVGVAAGIALILAWAYLRSDGGGSSSDQEGVLEDDQEESVDGAVAGSNGGLSSW